MCLTTNFITKFSLQAYLEILLYLFKFIYIFSRGLLLATSGRLDEAVISYKLALRSRPWFAQAHVALAAAHTSLGELQLAQEVRIYF